MSRNVTIVGGGIIGLMTARMLCEMNHDFQITIIDKDLLGFGASPRSAGMHFPIGRTQTAREMSAFSQSYYNKLFRIEYTDCSRVVDLDVHGAPEYWSEIHTKFISEASLTQVDNSKESFIRPNGYYTWRAKGSHCTDVALLIRHMRRDLSSNVNVKIVEGIAISNIQNQGGVITLSLSDGSSVSSKHIVLCPGPWANSEAFARHTKPLNIRIKKVIAFHIKSGVNEKSTAQLFINEDAFLLPLLERNEWLYSYTCTTWNVKPDIEALKVLPEDVAAAKQIIERYAPELVSKIDSARVFCDAYSETSTPIITRLENAKNIIFAGAANGSGYRLAPAIGRQVTDLLLQ